MKYWGLRDGSTVNVTSQLTGLWGIVMAWFGHNLAVPPWWPPSTNVWSWSRGNTPWSVKDIPMKLPEHQNRSTSTPDDLGCTNWINKMVRSLVLLELLGSVHIHRFKTKTSVRICFRFALCKWKKHCVGCNFISLGDQPPDLHLEIKRGQLLRQAISWNGFRRSPSSHNWGLWQRTFQECSQPPRLHQPFSRRPDPGFRPWRGCPCCRQQPRISRAVMGLTLRSWSHSVAASPGSLCPEDGRDGTPGQLDCQSQKRGEKTPESGCAKLLGTWFLPGDFHFLEGFFTLQTLCFLPEGVSSPESCFSGRRGLLHTCGEICIFRFSLQKGCWTGNQLQELSGSHLFQEALSGPPDGYISLDSMPPKNHNNGLEASLHVVWSRGFWGSQGVMLPCCLQAQSFCLDWCDPV